VFGVLLLVVVVVVVEGALGGGEPQEFDDWADERLNRECVA